MDGESPKRKRIDEYEREYDQSSSDEDDGRPTKMTASISEGASEEDEAIRREQRLMKNREKARQRRNKKKVQIEEMQRNIVVLSRMNSDLRRKNEDLIRKLAQYGPAGGVDPGVIGGQSAGLGCFDVGANRAMLGSSFQAQGGMPGDAGVGAASQLGTPGAQGAPLQMFTTAADVTKSASFGASSANQDASAAPPGVFGDMGSLFSMYNSLNAGGIGMGFGGIGPTGAAITSAIDPALLHAFFNQQQNAAAVGNTAPQASQLGGLSGVASPAALLGATAIAPSLGSGHYGSISGLPIAAHGTDLFSRQRQVDIAVNHYQNGREIAAAGLQGSASASGLAGAVPNAAAVTLGGPNSGSIEGPSPASIQALARQLNLQTGTSGTSNNEKSPGTQL